MQVTSEYGVDDLIYVDGQRFPYKIQARDENYIIATKPFNPKKTVLYFIIDLESDMRGPDDRVFCMGYETRKQCEERLKELQDGKIMVSYRRSVKTSEVDRIKKVDYNGAK